MPLLDRLVSGNDGSCVEPILRRDAWRNAANLAKRNSARATRETGWQRAACTGDPSPDVEREVEQWAEWKRAFDEVEKLLPDDRMRAVFRLRRAGVRETAEFARVLSGTGLNAVEQKRVVKRQKDRLDKWLRRSRDARRILGPLWAAD